MRPVDLAVIAIYFAVVPAIGFHLKRFDTTGEDFFMAGRGMTAWIAGLSFIPANPGSLETMGWAAFAYQHGMLGARACLIGAIPAILVRAVVMMPFHYIGKTHSAPGYLLVAVLVSLVTRLKPEAELKNLVYGLTPLPSGGHFAWWQRPVFRAGVCAVAPIAVNIIFW